MGIPANMRFLAGVDLVLVSMRQHWSALVRSLVFAYDYGLSLFQITSEDLLFFVLFIIVKKMYTCMNVLIYGL